jgi:peroxiredoxin
LTVIGSKLSPSGIAPDFASTTSTVRRSRVSPLAASGGSIRILNVVNSLDTPIYDIETQRWEQLRSPLAGNVVVLTISMDLPFAQARWGQGADSATRCCRCTGLRSSGAPLWGADQELAHAAARRVRP